MNELTFKRIAYIFLSIVIGVVFIFSAVSKIPTLEQFGWTIVESTFLNWTSAEWFARILIGFELWLGILFITHLWIKRVAIPISFILLIVFSIYLMMVIFTQGNSGNCGCFGEVISMTPLESILKNIALIILILILKLNSIEWKFKYHPIVLIILALVCMAIPIGFNPPESIYITEKDAELKKPIPLSILYNSDKNKAPNIDIRKGHHIITFLSLTCSYCRKAAKRIRIMKNEHPSIPFYAIINGDSTDLDDFMKDTRMTNIEYSIFNGAQEFAMMNNGTNLPTIKWVIDTTLVRESNYLTLDEKEILTWLETKN